jgi:hypothetical protein
MEEFSLPLSKIAEFGLNYSPTYQILDDISPNVFVELLQFLPEYLGFNSVSGAV